MLVVIGVLMTLTAAIASSRVRLPKGANAAKLGWMSEQWLAEHRVSYPS
jgi:hypothetical protein